ncbi:hypothetical protein [Hyalangium rubrum]|uniref:Type II secretion system protein GspE N-terminal domain-containing protein n=1 Tax=Hyalangium rubrum TaxID=3103134 RepID=A0ABU5H511_9BACT|nr:hypothetical protein [Hyalangium sp. s54d21]MDY7227170.1 hypothetical protein [Hyalangium sp. s54d21]
MAEKPIQNCEVRFQFKCPKQWDALRETAEAGVRLCDACQKHVYLCESKLDAARHAREGHCVAVPGWVTSPSDAPGGLPIPDRDIARLVPWELAEKHHLIALDRVGTTLVVAMSDPANVDAINEVRFFTGYNVEVRAASRRDIEEALTQVAARYKPSTLELGVMAEEPAPKPGASKVLREAHDKKED